MHRCFSAVVAPIVETLKPTSIVEVGAGAGRLTRRLLAAEGAAQATIHAIDPRPAFDPDELAAGDERLVVHVERSETALPQLGAIDLALLDGDPNWYTVHAELELLAAGARAADRPPPVVVVHDVHWPFGRRDGYYDPAAIPEYARHKHAAAGLLPTQAEPDPTGLRLVPSVATREHGERNGVLTALHDFLAADADRWELIEIPGFHGLAVLVAASTAAADPAVRGLTGALEAPFELRRAARRAEAGRIAALLATDRAEAAEEWGPSKAQVEAAQRHLDELEASAHALATQIADAPRYQALHEAALWRVETLERDLAARDAERREAVAARDLQARQAVEAAVGLERAVEDLETVRSALAAAERESGELRAMVAADKRELAELEDHVRLLSGRASHLEEALSAARAEARAAHADALVLDERLRARLALHEEIAGHVRAAAKSRAWRWGHGLTRVARRLTFRRAVKSAGALDVALRALDRPLLPAGAPDGFDEGTEHSTPRSVTMTPR